MGWETLSEEQIEKNIDSFAKQIIDAIREARDPKVAVIKSKLGDLDETTWSRKLFVKPLPYEMTDTELSELFSRVGTVESAIVVKDELGKSMGYGFVVMSDNKMAQNAIECYSGKLNVDNKLLIVKQARPPAKPLNKFLVVAECTQLLADLKFENSMHNDAMKFANIAFETYRCLDHPARQKYKRLMINCLPTYIRAFLRVADDPINRKIERAEAEVNSLLEHIYKFQGVVPREAKIKSVYCVFEFFDEQRKKLAQENPASIEEFLTENFRRIWEMDLPEKEAEKQEWLRDVQKFCSREFADSVLFSTPVVLNKGMLERLEQLKQKRDFSQVRQLLNLVAEKTKQSSISCLQKVLRFKAPLVSISTGIRRLQNLCKVAYDQLNTENYEDLLKSLDEINRGDPRNIKIIQWKAYTNCLLERYPDAERDYRYLENAGEKGKITKWNMACVYYRLGKHSEAFIKLSEIEPEKRTEEVKQSLLGLALLINQTNYPIHNLVKETNPYLLSLGYVLTYDIGSQEQAEAYLSRLIKILREDFQPLPENEPIDEEEAKKTVQFFLKYELLEEGIRHFTVRIDNRQVGWHVREALATLYELSGDPERAFSSVYSFFVMIKDKIGLEYVKKESFQFLLELCKQHKDIKRLCNDGIDLLNSYGRTFLNEEQYQHYVQSLGSIKPEPTIEDKEKLWNEIYSLNNKLRFIIRPRQIVANREDLHKYASCLGKIYDNQISHKAESMMKTIVDLLCRFTDMPIGEETTKIMHEISMLYDELKKQIDVLGPRAIHDFLLVKNIGTCIGEAERELTIGPEPTVRILNPSLPKEGILTSLVVEVTNNHEHPIERFHLELETEPTFELQQEKTMEFKIPAKDSEVVTYSIRRIKETDAGTFYLTYSFKYRGKDYAPRRLSPFSIPIKSFTEIPPRYVHNRAIRDNEPDKFHGREKDIEDLLQIFSPKGKGGPIFLDGIRRVGKTSIINFLVPKLPDNIIPVVINMEGVDGVDVKDTPTFLYQICQKIASRISEDDAASLVLELNDFYQAPVSAFNNCISRFQNLCPNRKVLLIIDEFQRIIESILESKEGRPGLDETPLNLMRSYIGSGILDFLFTGSMRLKLMREYFRHPIVVSFIKRSISFLSEEAAQSTLEKPVEHDGVIYPEKVVRIVWELVRGHPQLTQLIGDGCLDKLNSEKRHVVTPHDVEQVAGALLEDERNFQFWWDNKYLGNDELEAIKKFVKLQKSSGEGVSIKEFAQELYSLGGDMTLNNLLEQQVITLKGDRYLIKGKLLERYIQRMLEKMPGVRLDYCAIIFDHENFFITLEEEYHTRVLKRVYEKATGEVLSEKDCRSMIQKFKEGELFANKDLEKMIKDIRMRKVPEGVLQDAIRSIINDCEKCGTIVDYLAVGCFHLSKFYPQGLTYLSVNPKFRIEHPPVKGEQASDYALRRELVKKFLKDELYKEPRTIGTIMMISSDSDFIDAVINLRREGRRVLVRGFKSNTKDELKTEVGEDFKFIDDIMDLNAIIEQSKYSV